MSQNGMLIGEDNATDGDGQGKESENRKQQQQQLQMRNDDRAMICACVPYWDRYRDDS